MFWCLYFLSSGGYTIYTAPPRSSMGQGQLQMEKVNAHFSCKTNNAFAMQMTCMRESRKNRWNALMGVMIQAKGNYWIQ